MGGIFGVGMGGLADWTCGDIWNEHYLAQAGFAAGACVSVPLWLIFGGIIFRWW